MPDFDQNLNPIIKQESRPSIDYTSNPVKDSSVPDFNSSPINNEPTEDVYSLFNRLSKGSNPNSKGIFVTNKTLSDNKRYDSFNPTITDQEDFASYGQGALSQLGNAFIKTGAIAAGTFAQSFTNIPNTISAIRNKDFSKLSGDPNGYEGSIDSWLKNMEDYAPNYYSNLEKENSYVAMIPFAPGSANFWGNSVIKNLGFTAGAIAGAALQDVAITAFTGGVGSIPLISGQIGKAALFLNKLFTGVNNVDKVMDITKSLSIAGKSLLNVNNLARAAAYTKVASGFKYGAAIYGSAMTEAGVEARDGYRQVKDELLNQYKLENSGNDPFGEDLQEIENYATSAMNTRFGINMALLTVSNVIQFDNLFRSFGNAGNVGISGSLTKSLEDAGKVRLKKGSIDEFEKKVAESIKGKIWEVVKPKLPIILSEGVLEEGGQFSAEKGTFDYYTRKYKNPYKESNSENWNALNESIRSTTTGLSEQFGTKEGIQNMLIGAISSMITGGIQGKIDDIRGKGSDARLTSTINMLNTYGMTGILANKYSDTLNSTAISKEMKEAIKEGNVFKFKNLKSDLFFNYVNSRLGSDMHGVTVAQLEMLKDLSKEEFEKSFGMDFNKSNRSTVDSYVDSLTSQANSIKDKSDAINDTFINPFTQIADPKTEEEVKESEKYNTFEDWKTNLKYYATRAADLNQRLDSIQESVSKINSNVSNDVLNSVSDRESLSDLAVNYEQEANRLNLTITEFTSASDRRTIREKIKSLRTISERINLAISNNSLDTDTFHKVLNFELNFQDSKKDNVVELENINPLYIFAKDINSINLSKKQASILFENLATEKGLDKFSEEADEIKNIDLAKVVAEKPTNKANSFTNSDKEVEELVIGREYQVDKTKRSNVLKISDDRYQVTEPNGKVSFFKTKEEAKEFANDITSESLNLSKVKVLSINDDGTVKIEDINGDILNISPKRLSGYKKLKTEQEKILKDSETIKNDLEESEKNSGIPTLKSTQASQESEPEGKLKNASILFTSTTSPSDQITTPHVQRSREFLNNAKSFKNRNKLRVILVTPNQLKSLGLEGLVQISYGVSADTKIEDIDGALDKSNGFVAQVYIENDGDKNYFVDKDGNRLTQVGIPIDLQKVVFQTMPSTALTYANGTPRYRQNQKEEAETNSKAWAIYRARLFEEPPGRFQMFNFTISRGIPIENITNGLKEKNQVGGILIPNNLIPTQEGLIVIPTTGTVTHNEENIKFPNGIPLLQYQDTLVFLNNRVFNDNESKGIFEVIKALSEDIVNQSKQNLKISLNKEYITFLQHVLYSKSGIQLSDNQFNIDTLTMSIKIGKSSYPITEIANNEKEIIEQLKNTFSNINNNTLTKFFNKPFIEFYIGEDGKLTNNEWVNYQSFLLSSNYPNGSSRNAANTPLTTSVAKSTESVPYSFKQKYVTISQLELPVNEVEKAPAPVIKNDGPADVIIGKYNLNGTVNTYELSSGDVRFSGTVNAEGNVSIKLEEGGEETIRKIAANDNVLNTVIIPALKANNLFDPLASDLNLVSSFIKIRIAADITKIKSETPTVDPVTPEVKVETPTSVTVKQVKSKLQEIEKQSVTINITQDADGKMEQTSQEVIDNIKVELDKTGLPYSDVVSNKKGSTYSIVTKDGQQHEVLRTLAMGGKLIPSVLSKAKWINHIAKTEKESVVKAVESLLAKQSQVENQSVTPIPASTDTKYDPSKTIDPIDEYRKVGLDNEERMTSEEIEIFREWHKENVPNIPFEILDNMITTITGEKAWGVFENGVAKFVRGGLRATEYHEIFEAIYNSILSPTEQQALLTEFRLQPGTFVDRQSGKSITYLNATNKEAKERIADDFSDFRKGKLPARSIGEAIYNLFNKILQFFKSFVNNPTLKESLFKAINTGKFKNQELLPSTINSSAEYRAVENLTEKQTHDFIQDMTARAAGILFSEGNKKLLFSPERITSSEMFDKIEKKYIAEGKLDALGDKAWNQLKIKTKNSLRTLGINFNEEDKVDINNEESSKNNYAPEPFSVDWKKDSTGAVRFSLATLFLTQQQNQEEQLSLELPSTKKSNIKGLRLLNFSRAFVTVLDKLSNSSSISKGVNKLLDLANFDSNYVRLFQRVGGDLSTKTIPFQKFDENDWRYFIQFMQTFTKQKPDALIQYVSNVDVYTAPANLYTAISQTQNSWAENMKAIAKNRNNNLINLNRETRSYEINKDELVKFPIRAIKDQISFLSAIGIIFPLETYASLKKFQKNKFSESVSSIYSYIGKEVGIMSISGKTLNINGPIATLAELFNKVNNPNQESTYFGVTGERVGSFSENNTASVFENEFNESESLDELIQSRPELQDIFSQNSMVMKPGGLFFDKNRNRTKSIKISYIQGTKDIIDNKGFKTSSLSEGSRLTQQINQNLGGNYYILIPGDSSTEWMINLGHNVEFSSIGSNKSWNNIYSIFNGYLIDDINLALNFDKRTNLKNVGTKGKELRFFKEILSEKDLLAINELIENDATKEEINNYIASNSSSINNSIKELIDQKIDKTKKLLIDTNQILKASDDVFMYYGLDDNFSKAEKINKKNLSEKELNNLMLFTNVNYIINNIEMHKAIFGDPYQFAVKNGNLDETKRIKSFLSPRKTTIDTPEYNTFLNQKYNKVDDIELTPSDPGYHNYKSYTNTVTVSDVVVAGSLSNIINAYSQTNETDGVSWLMDNTYKEIKLKNGQWSDEAEAFHQWQMAYTRQTLPSYRYSSEKLKQIDNKLISKPAPQYTIEVLKPIVSGNKFGSNIIDNVLDKFSQMPIYYSMVKGTNLEKLYLQMFNEDIGYVIVNSGRKVGAENSHNLYNPDASFNNDSYNNKIQVSWKSYGIQVEMSGSDKEKEQTRGSQTTKIATIDLFTNGVASSPEAEAEYLRNTDILNKMHSNAYNQLLLKLGVRDLGYGFEMPDGKAVSETLMYEMMRRKLSDNIIDTIQLDNNNQFIIPFEASPAYLQIRSILYSIVNKAINSPKMSGGGYVQVPSTMFESAAKGRGLAIKREGKWVKITNKEYQDLPDGDKSKVLLTDSSLKFYSKEDPYCELMLPHWFKEKFGTDKTDEEILKYLNSTKEGQSILKGIGFRIPTQSLSSIEVFRVKGFLPSYMGSTVVVPSEITTKSGSDFDIDKLNMYLKSVYVDSSNNVRLIKYLGSEEATKQFFTTVYNDIIQKRIDKIDNYDEFRGQLWDIFVKIEQLEEFDLFNIQSVLTDKQSLFYDNHVQIFQSIINAAAGFEINPSEYIENEVERLGLKREELSKEILTSILKDSYVNDMYKKSLENEYYDSLEKLITLPENFERLITPVDDSGLEEMSKRLNSLRGYDESTIKNRLLDIVYINNVRHAFITGKRWVGISSVNLTNLSLRQKSKTYIDLAKIDLLNIEDQFYLGDGSIILPHNSVEVDGELRVSLSGSLTHDGKSLISNRLSGYTTAFVDVSKNPFILDVVQSNLVVGVHMFLENIGAGEYTSLFMNQPIIYEYIKMLDSIEAKSLFIKSNINTVKRKFEHYMSNQTESFDINMLERNIGEYYSSGEMMTSGETNSEQIAILNEFLKYAKMAEFNFAFTQATNYDTTRFGSGDSLSRKQWRTQQASETNIISSVDNVFKNTFIGEQERFLSKAFDSIGTILKLEKDDLKAITDSIILPYGIDKYMSADKFDKLSLQLKSAFIDYIIQTKLGISERIDELLINDVTSVASVLTKAKVDYPELDILKDLEVVSGNRIGGTQSIKLTANIKEAYDENLYTGMMREMRDFNEPMRKLYYDIVYLSILQGSYKSAISINNIIPIEDYSKIVSPIFESISADQSLNAFEFGMFHRNNFQDDVIMPLYSPKFFIMRDGTGQEQLPELDENFNEIYMHTSPAFPSIKKLGIKPSDRKVLLVSEKYSSFYLKNEFLKVPRVLNDFSVGRIDVVTGRSILTSDYAKRLQKGDYSLNDVFGYQKVKLSSGEPLIAYDRKGEPSHVYKLINLYGDGNRATENYTDFKPSVINNGSIKINNEILDSTLIEYFGGEVTKEDIAPPVRNVTREEVKQEDTVESLRAEERIELQEAFPNITPINDKIEKESLNTKEDIIKFEKIYDKYDELITPLLKSEDNNTSAPNVNNKSLFTDEEIEEINGNYIDVDKIDINKLKQINKPNIQKFALLKEDMNKGSLIQVSNKRIKVMDFLINNTNKIIEELKQALLVEDNSKSDVSLVDKPQEISEEEWISLTEEVRKQIIKCNQ